MNREALKELGLTDDQIEAVMKSHGTTVNATKEALDTVTTDRDELKVQLTDRDTQLTSLKEIDHEGLKAKIAELETANTTTATEYQSKLDKQAFDFTLDRSLTGAKVRNTKAIKALLDTENIKLDGEKLLNLDDQLAALRESDPYLFDVEEKQQDEPAKPAFSSGAHQTDNKPSDPFAAKLAKYN